MNAKHTPGPWIGEVHNGPGFGCIIVDDESPFWRKKLDDEDREGPRIAQVEADWGEECIANIQLIAAAPELLACLQWAARFAEGSRDIAGSSLNNPVFNAWIDRCHEAIAKTEGGAV